MAKSRAKPKVKSKGKSKNKKNSFFGKILRFLTWLLLIVLLIGFTARFISPEKIWIFAFIGISFPYLYLLSFLIFIFWLLFRKRIAMYIFAVILICSPLFFKYFNIFSSSKNIENIEFLKVMSFNVRDFNIGNQFKDSDKKFRRNSILEFVKEETPGIICFQEVYYDSLHKYKTIDTLIDIQAAKNAHTFYSFKRKGHGYGIVTLSKYPIINRGIVAFNNLKNQCIFTDILFNEDTIRIFNAHLSSIGLSHEDLNFVDNVSSLDFNDKDTLEFEQSFRKIAGRLKKAFIERANQSDRVSEQIALSPYPSILCCDINDTPSSYAYRELTKKMSDAFLESGSGLGKSYNGILPYFRIDYIFYSEDFKSYNFKTHYKDLSDHYPITANLYLESK